MCIAMFMIHLDQCTNLGGVLPFGEFINFFTCTCIENSIACDHYLVTHLRVFLYCLYRLYITSYVVINYQKGGD